MGRGIYQYVVTTVCSISAGNEYRAGLAIVNGTVVFIGSIGPILVLLSLYPWFQYGWSSYVTYTGLGLMVAVSIWDMVSPANKRCDDETCTA